MLPPLQNEFPKHQRNSTTKLASNLMDKMNYVVHYRNLKFYLQQGMIITKIHRIHTFKQSPWLKVYIVKTTKNIALPVQKVVKKRRKNEEIYYKQEHNVYNDSASTFFTSTLIFTT